MTQIFFKYLKYLTKALTGNLPTENIISVQNSFLWPQHHLLVIYMGRPKGKVFLYMVQISTTTESFGVHQTKDSLKILPIFCLPFCREPWPNGTNNCISNPYMAIKSSLPKSHVCYVIPFWEPPALPIHYFHRAKYDVSSSYDAIP